MKKIAAPKRRITRKDFKKKTLKVEIVEKPAFKIQPKPVIPNPPPKSQPKPPEPVIPKPEPVKVENKTYTMEDWQKEVANHVPPGGSIPDWLAKKAPN